MGYDGTKKMVGDGTRNRGGKVSICGRDRGYHGNAGAQPPSLPIGSRELADDGHRTIMGPFALHDLYTDQNKSNFGYHIKKQKKAASPVKKEAMFGPSGRRKGSIPPKVFR